MAQVRTFVAIDCSDRLRAACDKVITALTDVVDGARWVQPDNLHLTLKFLGEVEDRELHEVCRKVATAVQDVPSFAVVCRSVGAFPSVERPHTIWADIEDPNESLVGLQQKVALALAELGFPLERRPFKPHLTLGRTKSRHFQSTEWQQAVERFRNREFGSLHVSELVVYSSELERRRPIYTALARCPLS